MDQAPARRAFWSKGETLDRLRSLSVIQREYHVGVVVRSSKETGEGAWVSPRAHERHSNIIQRIAFTPHRTSTTTAWYHLVYTLPCAHRLIDYSFFFRM